MVALFAGVFAFVFIWQTPRLFTPPIPEGTRAAIVDQLYINYPNEDFTTKITKELQGYGFEVDHYQGDAITVDFYRNLPIYNHKLIVFRAHSGAMRPGLLDTETITGIYLFTNEPYTKTKYPKEQLNDELVKAGVVEDSPDLFAIGAKFVASSMEGNFNSTVVIIDGCSCLYNTDLAKAFVNKGVSCYIAWDASVDLDYVDNATAYLVRQLCGGKVTIEEAVTNTMNVIGPDPKYKAQLKYYPPQSGDSTLKELVQLAENG